ncbi:MAG: amidohydrolase family protein [Bacteroidetes bacterium]|nr:amidohydrolase family protein [Bacteroidota bacterium]
MGSAPWIRQIDENTDIGEVVTEAQNCSATGIKLYAYLNPDLVTKIVAEANKQNLKVWAHAFVYPATPEDLVSAGVNSLSHAPFLIYPTDWQYQPQGSFDLSKEVLDSKRLDDILNNMQKKGIILDPTLYLFEVTVSELSDEKPELNEKLELAYEITRKAYQKGIKIAVGTDFSLINEETDKPTIFDEMYLLVDEIGMSPIEVITACTKTNAELLGIEETCGTIEVGKRANLIVLKSNPAENIMNIEDQAIIIKNGEIVYDKRQIR